MFKYYAGIGDRKTPQEILELMKSIAILMGRAGFTLRSGGAKGADSAFEEGADTAHFPKEIFRPNDAWHVHWAMDTVKQFHPNPHGLSEYPRLLMARNAFQVLGRNGYSPVNCVICWAPGGKGGGGGTGQAIRIANYYAIPVHDLGDYEWELAYRTLVENPV